MEREDSRGSDHETDFVDEVGGMTERTMTIALGLSLGIVVVCTGLLWATVSGVATARPVRVVRRR